VPRACAIVLQPADPPSPALLAAERRLAALVVEAGQVEEQVEVLSRELCAFEAAYRAATEPVFAELEKAQRLGRRLQRLEEELGRLGAVSRGEATVTELQPYPLPPRRPADAPGRRVRGGPRQERRAAPRAPPPEAAPPEDLKTLYRRLARLLHPDLVQGDAAERARRSDLMARANEAWRRRDQVALELLAERLGAGGAEALFTESDRLAHLARRAAAMEAALARLSSALHRLETSPAARLREEAARRAQEGGDALAEALELADGQARAARQAALERLDALAPAARSFSHAPVRPAVMPPLAGREELERLVAGSALVRKSGEEDGPFGSEARTLARRLVEGAAASAPWPAALTLLAYLGEAAGCPPPPFASTVDLALRWDALRAGWDAAPDLGRALADLPREVEIGLRLGGDGIVAGLQLAGSDLAAGVRRALADELVRALAVRVLLALGPRGRCRRCEVEVYAVHLLRLGGLDEVHGLACPTCGGVLRTFYRYGPPEGLAALVPLAVDLGLLAEQRVRIGRSSVALQMLPSERARLTVRALLRRVRELCLAPHGIELPPATLRLRVGDAALPAGAMVPEGVRVELIADGLPARELARAIRDGAKRRFKA